MSDIEAIRDKYLEQIEAVSDGDALEAIRLAALGKKGEISLLLKTLGKMTPEARKRWKQRLWMRSWPPKNWI